ERDRGQLHGGARLSPVSSGDDDRAVVICKRGGGVFVATDRAGLPRASGLHGVDGNAEAGFSDDQPIPAAAFGGDQETIPASVETVPKSRDGEAGACGLGRNQDPSECEQTRKYELRQDEKSRKPAEGGNRAVVRRSRTARPRRGSVIRGRQEWR